jgi:hypothetical protein
VMVHICNPRYWGRRVGGSKSKALQAKAGDPIWKQTIIKKGLGCGSNGRELQQGGPEFNL